MISSQCPSGSTPEPLSVLARRGVLECRDAETMGSWDRLLNLRKQPFVCPEPYWLFWVDSSHSLSDHERNKPPRFRVEKG